MSLSCTINEMLLLIWIISQNLKRSRDSETSLMGIIYYASTSTPVHQSAHGCALSGAFSKISYFLMFLNIQIDLLILKTYDGQFTLTTKKSLHIIFKPFCRHIGWQVRPSSGTDVYPHMPILRPHATRFHERHISSMTFTSAHLYGNVYTQVAVARALAVSSDFGLLGEQS